MKQETSPPLFGRLKNLREYIRQGCPDLRPGAAGERLLPPPVVPVPGRFCRECKQQLFGDAVAAVNESMFETVVLFCSDDCRTRWRFPPVETGPVKLS